MPQALALLHAQLSGARTDSTVFDTDEAMWIANDSFGCGCSIAFLCSRGALLGLRECVVDGWLSSYVARSVAAGC